MTFIDRDDYDVTNGADSSERDELAAAGLHVVSSDDEDEDIDDEDASKTEDAKASDDEDFGNGDEEELSAEEREKQEALADFLPEEDM